MTRAALLVGPAVILPAALVIGGFNGLTLIGVLLVAAGIVSAIRQAPENERPLTLVAAPAIERRVFANDSSPLCGICQMPLPPSLASRGQTTPHVCENAA